MRRAHRGAEKGAFTPTRRIRSSSAASCSVHSRSGPAEPRASQGKSDPLCAYRYGPSREKAQWRWITWGSVVAAIAWLIVSLLFSCVLDLAVDHRCVDRRRAQRGNRASDGSRHDHRRAEAHGRAWRNYGRYRRSETGLIAANSREPDRIDEQVMER